jgi:hypothetical protein
VWYATLQAGNGLAVDGAHMSTDMALTSVSGGFPLATGTYALFLLSDHTGASAAPPGSWISKVAFGCSAVSGTAIWPTTTVLNPTTTAGLFVPTADTLVPNGAASLGAGTTVYLRYLVDDSSGTTVTDTASGSGSPTTLYLAGNLLTTGPY